MAEERKQEIIKLTEHIVSIINKGDYETYQKMVDPQVTCFEPETLGNMVPGLPFHKYYLDHVLGKDEKPFHVNILSPRVHLMGEDAACIGYIRLTQYTDRCTQTEETRVWQRKDGKWQMVHLHRSSSK